RRELLEARDAAAHVERGLPKQAQRVDLAGGRALGRRLRGGWKRERSQPDDAEADRDRESGEAVHERPPSIQASSTVERNGSGSMPAAAARVAPMCSGRMTTPSAAARPVTGSTARRPSVSSTVSPNTPRLRFPPKTRNEL